MVAGHCGHRTSIRIRNSRPFGAGGFALCAQIDHDGDVADELDLEALLRRPQHYLRHKPAWDPQPLGPGIRVGKVR